MEIPIGDEDSLNLLSKLSDKHQKSYKTLRDLVAPKLSSSVTVGKDHFTSHGYDHVVRVFKSLDELLSDEAVDDLQDDERFLLCVSVLLHDIVMTINPEKRCIHAEEAAKIIFEEVDENFLSGEIVGLHDIIGMDEAKIIGLVISGHSDPKGENGERVRESLREIAMIKEGGPRKRIRVGILGALLRFADELDCSSHRIEDCQNLEMQRFKTKSKEHARRCMIVASALPNGTNRNGIIITLHEVRLSTGADLENDCRHALKVEEKIRSSLKEVNDLVFGPNEVPWWSFSENCVETIIQAEEIRTALENARKIAQEQEVRKVYTPTPISQPLATSEPSVLSDEPTDYKISQLLSAWVRDDKLLREGHFYLDDEHRARDWIDTSSLLGDCDRVKEIACGFVDQIERGGFKEENLCIVGEGFPGLILASQISLIGGFPCTYHVPRIEENDHIEEEKQLFLSEGWKVLVATDVVATGKSILRTIEDIARLLTNGQDDILRVLTIFYRKPIGCSNANLGEIAKKVIWLNNEFDIEICAKDPEKCLLRSLGIAKHENEPSK